MVIVHAAKAPHVALREAARQPADAEQLDVRFTSGGETVPRRREEGPARLEGAVRLVNQRLLGGGVLQDVFIYLLFFQWYLAHCYPEIP